MSQLRHILTRTQPGQANILRGVLTCLKYQIYPYVFPKTSKLPFLTPQTSPRQPNYRNYPSPTTLTAKRLICPFSSFPFPSHLLCYKPTRPGSRPLQTPESESPSPPQPPQPPPPAPSLTSCILFYSRCLSF